MNPTEVRAEQFAEVVQSRGWTVAVVESLTSGAIASQLGKLPDAASWFLGAVVAYAPSSKFDVLGVPPGPVVSPTAACAMATTVAERFGADLALAATGVGGPGPESGIRAGTVWFAVRHPAGTQSFLRHFSGPPESVVGQTVSEALKLLLAACSDNADHSLADGMRMPGAGRADVRRPTAAPVAGDLPITPTWSG